MTITVGKNIGSITALKELAKSTSALSKSYERISSGLRINHASDDAAGLALSADLLNKSILSRQANRNINDGISLLNIQENALSALRTILGRIEELAEQAANGALTSTQRSALNTEAQALTTEYARIINTTKFNGTNLLTTNSTLSIQVGSSSDSNSRINITLSALTQSLSSSSVTYTGLGTFGTLRSAAASNRLVTSATGDFNQDGYLDMVALSDTGILPLWLGNGDGTFKVSGDLGGNGVGLGVGDFNNDGKLDIISEQTSNLLGVRLGNGDGTFKATTSYNAGADPNNFSVNDFNADGYDDVAALDTTAGTVAVLLANNDGTFKAKVQYSARTDGWSSIVDADVNSDGRIDLIAGYAGGFVTYLGNSDGTFKAGTLFVQGSGDRPLASGDFNEDGKTDLVSLENLQAVMHLGNNDGTFKAAVAFDAGTSLESNAADINGDGHLDLMLKTSATTMTAYLGNGNGTFKIGGSLTMTVPSGTVNYLRFADFNSDGVYDISSVSYLGNTVEVALQNTSSSSSQNTLDLTSQSSARSALDIINTLTTEIDQAYSQVASTLARLQVAFENNAAYAELAESAAGKIRDANIADEVSLMVRNQIIQSAAMAVLAQANINSQKLLSLILIGED